MPELVVCCADSEGPRAGAMEPAGPDGSAGGEGDRQCEEKAALRSRR